ncbi:MAG: glycerol kinase GlpK [Candidatus Krumholzibacteria bacterium]|nr:glycerol kinase GlpK [Candidatus Krumholzibacteria bacterium]
MPRCVGAIDQGTTSTRFILFDHDSSVLGSHQVEHRQIYPGPGLVEHDAREIWANTETVIRETLSKTGIRAEEIASIGVTNQRETTLLWNPRNGEPYGNAIVWQDLRTQDLCRELASSEDLIRQKTGLPLATYFSGPKIAWLLRQRPELREAASRGELLFGTMDSWLIWKLSGGLHISDVSNASRTMLMNLHSLDWDEELLELMDIPREILPEIRSSSEVYGTTLAEGPFGGELPIAGNLGDQQAALFGQCCFAAGEAKSTYGTGCFLLMNMGEEATLSRHGLLTTLAYQLGDEKPVYALEGSVAIAGSLVQWFRDQLGLIEESPEIETLARSVEDNGGLYFVPAFAGLFAPHWDSSARGVITGLTHFTGKGHLARAVLEASAFQIREVFDAMHKDSGIQINSLKVDGGMTLNELLMQFQADLLDLEVQRPSIIETTALGAAYAAGLAVGFWNNEEDLKEHWKLDQSWQADMNPGLREKKYANWKKAVERSRGLGESEGNDES